MLTKFEKFLIGQLLVASLGITGCLAVFSWAAVSNSTQVPMCQYEDGNPNGKPCYWIDPETSTWYYQTSDNYK